MGVQDVLPVLLTLMDFPPLPKGKRHLRDGIGVLYVGTVASTNGYWNLPAARAESCQSGLRIPGTGSYIPVRANFSEASRGV